MIILTTLLFFLCIIALVLGLIRPKLVIRWGSEDKKNRKKVFKYYGIGIVILFALNIYIAGLPEKVKVEKPKKVQIVKEVEADVVKEVGVKAQELTEDYRKILEMEYVDFTSSEINMFKEIEIKYKEVDIELSTRIAIDRLIAERLDVEKAFEEDRKKVEELILIKGSEYGAKVEENRIKAEKDRIKIEEDKRKAEKEVIQLAKAEKEAKELSKAEKEAKELSKADEKAIADIPVVETLTEDKYKELCIDLPWSEVIKDRSTYVGTYLKKDLMVREIAKDSISGEKVYICGEKKDEGVYVGGTFTVYDKREDKTKPIELYDKIYVHGQIKAIYMTFSSYNPEFEVKYVKFNGKFGQ